MLAGVCLVFALATNAQRKSPHTTAEGMIGAAKVTITYGAPSVKGREVFGKLVPYDKAWRAGADEATIFETSKELKVEGKTLPAGKYSLFITPAASGEWTLTFNSQTGQWGINDTGAANFDPAKNVIVVKTMAKKGAMTEQLSYKVTSTGFDIAWDKLEAKVKAK